MYNMTDFARKTGFGRNLKEEMHL